MKKILSFISLIICISVVFPRTLLSQNGEKQYFIPGIITKIGAPQPSTGVQQTAPEISNIAAIAPDVLCIEIDACRILPAVQIPYIADPDDVVSQSAKSALGETRHMQVTRNGYPLGMLVGMDRKIITIYERLVGKHLNTELADNASSYVIASSGDGNYKNGVRPVEVWRKTKPTGWTEEIRSSGEYHTAKHLVYLKLKNPLKAGETYLVSMPYLDLKQSAVYYVHDPLLARSDAVHTSQIGFRSDDPFKCAYLSEWMGNGGGYRYPENLDFWLVDAMTNEKVFSGKAVIQWKAEVPEGIGTYVNHVGADLLRLDFSSFDKPGRYRVCVDGVGCGYDFDISGNTWKDAFLVSMKGVLNHRSGIPLGPPFTDFVRPRVFHPQDGIKVYQSTCSLLNSGNGLNALGTDKNNFGNLVAGITDVIEPEAWGAYMDAGDWDRRIQHLATQRLQFELMEMNPDFFDDLCLNIPESGNELPDIADEAIFGIDMYRRLQTPEGGIRGGVESSEHPVIGSTSWEEVHAVLVYAPDHWSSYIYAGVAARAAYVLKSIGKSTEAEKWERSAIKAMEWAEIEYPKWKSSPDYAKVTDRAKNAIPPERNLAAVELYRLTRNKKWHDIYLSTRNIQSSRTEAAFIYSRLDKSLVKKKAQQQAIDSLLAEADRIVELSNNNAFGITNGAAGRALGSSSYSVPASATLVRAHFLTGEQKYLKTILRSGLYTAGANPMNLCLTTGVGQNHVLYPLHEDTRHTGQPAPLGITVFGPREVALGGKLANVYEQNLDKIVTPSLTKWPSSEAYFDIYGWDVENEYVINTPLGPTEYIWGYLASRK